MTDYTSNELAAELDIPFRLLLTWHMKGWLAPSVQEAHGAGSKRLWSENDLRRGKLINRLVPLLHPDLVGSITREFKND